MSESVRAMDQRHLSYTSGMSGMGRDQLWNYPSPRLQLENASALHPTQNAAVSAANGASYLNVTLGPNGHASSIFSSGIQDGRIANTGTSRGSYSHLSSVGDSGRISQHHMHAQHVPSFCNQPAIGDTRGRGDSLFENGRVLHKRKVPADYSTVYNSRNTNGNYNVGSSSHAPILSDHIQMPVSESHYLPRDLYDTLPSNRGSDFTLAAEGFPRNVRSRYSHPLQFGTNLAVNRSEGHQPHYLHPLANVSSQLNSFPPSMVSHHRTHPAGSNNANGLMEIGGRCHPNRIACRNSSISLPMLHPSTESTTAGQSSSSHRMTGYSTSSNYRPASYTGALEDNRWPPKAKAIAQPRQSRPLSIVDDSEQRNRRAGNSYGRFNSFSFQNSTHIRASQAIAMMDQSSFFDPRDLIDEHREMRLDIDNMGYEELLALEERIGNVSTGLSEDAISKCLSEFIHLTCPIRAREAEEKCVICLDEYKHGVNLGRLKCGHDFHSGCIRKWLLIKNNCPVCKAPALADPSCSEAK